MEQFENTEYTHPVIKMQAVKKMLMEELGGQNISVDEYTISIKLKDGKTVSFSRDGEKIEFDIKLEFGETDRAEDIFEKISELLK